MTETPKVPATEPVTETIIELVDRIDWRFVILAGAIGAVAVFAILAMIEHTDDAPTMPLALIDPDAESDA